MGGQNRIHFLTRDLDGNQLDTGNNWTTFNTAD